MSASKITISIDRRLLQKMDYFVAHKVFKTRSQAVQTAVGETVERLEHKRLEKESAKLNKDFEQQMADESLVKDKEKWPKY